MAARYMPLIALGVATASTAANIAPRATTAVATSTEEAQVTAVTGCHLHESSLYCIAGETEYQVDVTITATSDVPAQYTDCHSHGSDMFCVDSDGEDVQVHAEGVEATDEDDQDESEEETESDSEGTTENQHCHFHAGVEHCTGGSESDSSDSCEAPNRDYDIGLRVGLLFVILATSSFGVFGPIFLQKWMPAKLNLVLVVLKQFGTGIIISTAFVHLYTHASLMFENECLGELGYEATASAIVMAGIFMSFFVEYIGQRVVFSKNKSDAGRSREELAGSFWSGEVVSVLVMEAGILFHSLLIGLTLVVSGDEYFITLFVVILFHQMFEGLALGSRIATIGHSTTTKTVTNTNQGSSSPSTLPPNSTKTASPTSSSSSDLGSSPVHHHHPPPPFPLRKKLGLAALFAFVTPIGMAIGIGVLQKFNGNNRATLVAIGTLDALSAGILVWVGLVEMWAADWMVGTHGKQAELADAPVVTVALAGAGLVGGLVLMSVLGKWA